MYFYELININNNNNSRNVPSGQVSFGLDDQ